MIIGETIRTSFASGFAADMLWGRGSNVDAGSTQTCTKTDKTTVPYRSVRLERRAWEGRQGPIPLTLPLKGRVGE